MGGIGIPEPVICHFFLSVTTVWNYNRSKGLLLPCSVFKSMFGWSVGLVEGRGSVVAL